jgi:hypothetical protein
MENRCLFTRDPFCQGPKSKKLKKSLCRNETERYFFWNRNEINVFQNRNGTKRKKKCFLTLIPIPNTLP